MSTKPNTSQITYDTGSNKQDLNNILDTVVPIADYTALRNYTGRATQVKVTADGIAGFFKYDSADTTSVDNGGTIIVAGTKRWKRVPDFYLPAGTAVATTVQGKLRQIVDWSDYVEPGDVDDTASLLRAIATGAEKIRFRGNKNIGGHITITHLSQFILEGEGRKSQITFTDTDAWLKITGTQATDVTPAAIAAGIEFKNITFSAFGVNSIPHIYMDWARQITFTSCFFYHCAMLCNHMNFWHLFDCISYDSDILVRYTRDLNENNEVSGAPRVTSCFFSNSLIDLEDCVDLMMVNTHMFQKGIKSRIVNLLNEGTDPTQKPKSSYWISNCVFDSINGLSLDFWDVGLSTFSGNFFSGGRTLGVEGVSFYKGWHNKFIGNTFVYCGTYGMTLESCDNNIVTGNNFIANPSGGLRTVSNCKKILISNNDFTTNPSVYGAPPTTQSIGYTDTSGNGTGILFTGNTFPADGVQATVYLPVSFENKNKISGNVGVLDSLGHGHIGTTPQRPVGVTQGYGPYYDTTLGIPIWCAGGAVWVNGAGTAV